MNCKQCNQAPRKEKSTLCVLCYREYQRIWYHKKRANNKKYLSTNAKRCKKYYRENKDKWKESNLIWKTKNKEKYREITKISSKKWRQNHPEHLEKAKIRTQSRRALGILTKETLDLVATLHPLCVYCGTKKDLQLEHITPVAKGGTNAFDNLAMACGSCNRSKYTKTLLQFIGIK